MSRKLFGLSDPEILARHGLESLNSLGNRGMGHEEASHTAAEERIDDVQRCDGFVCVAGNCLIAPFQLKKSVGKSVRVPRELGSKSVCLVFPRPGYRKLNHHGGDRGDECHRQ